MTYHKRDLLTSQSQQKSIFNECNKHSYPIRLSQSQSFRIECKAEERHFLQRQKLHQINSAIKPIQYTMNESNRPVQFRSEIVVHNHPETDLRIKRLRVNFYCHEEPTTNNLGHHSTTRSHSLNIPRRTASVRQNNENLPRINQLSTSQNLLHRWIDDICANEKLMINDNIVFFIKNGEFFARI